MKKVLVLSVFFLTACLEKKGENSSSTPSPKSSKWFSFSAPSLNDLPECDSSKEGMLYFLSENKTFKVCQNKAWETIDVSGEKGEVGLKGDPGSIGPVGPVGQAGAPGQCVDKNLAVVDEEGDFVGRPIFYFLNAAGTIDTQLYYLVTLPDGAKFLSKGNDFSDMNIKAYAYSAVSWPIDLGRGSSMENSTSLLSTINSQCVYPNDSCSGKCGFMNPPKKDFLVYEYDASGKVIYYRPTGNEVAESHISVSSQITGSYRGWGGTCWTLSPASRQYTIGLTQLNNTYTLPQNVETLITGLKMEMR